MRRFKYYELRQPFFFSFLKTLFSYLAIFKNLEYFLTIFASPLSNLSDAGNDGAPG